MKFADKVLFFFSFLGAFNGIILSIYLLFFTPKKYLSNYLLGGLLLMLSIRIGKSVAYFFDYNLPKIYLQIGLTACFFIGPLLYFFIKSEVNEIRRMPKVWAWQIAFWLVVILSVGIIYPYQNFPPVWGKYIIPLIYLQWGAYTISSSFLLIPLLKRIGSKGNLRIFEKWVLTVWGGVLILFISYVWAILNITKGSYINGALFFSLILYMVILVLLYRRKTSDLSSIGVQKYLDKKLSTDEAHQVIERLRKVMIENKLFKNPNLKLNDLAKSVEISGHQLSQILNDSGGKNFTLFINEYRIAEACKMLLAGNSPKIEAIGMEVGFNSRSTFFSTFKKLRGTTPALFQQQQADSSNRRKILA